MKSKSLKINVLWVHQFGVQYADSHLTNNLIRIGYTGDMTCYLNITREEAIERYLRDNPFTTYEDLIIENMINEFEFDDEFLAYSVYPKK